MKTLDLNTFFDEAGYDWHKDYEQIAEICRLTKTRHKPDVKEFKLFAGSEQPFLIKAALEMVGSKGFFEIGTGRGTACYTSSLIPAVSKIDTIDILPFDYKRPESIGYAPPSMVSNKDLYEMVSYKEKEKISFHTRRSFIDILNCGDHRYENSHDSCFIDGDHTDAKMISQDFLMSKYVLEDNGLMIWDDYSLVDSRFEAVKSVVDYVEQKYGFDTLLVEFRGLLFEGEKEKNSGVVLMKAGGIL